MENVGKSRQLAKEINAIREENIINANIWKAGIMGLVVGDALGLPVQFCDRQELKNNPVTQMEGYGTFNVPAGTWSDDSSLALATMDVIIQNHATNENDINVKAVMDNFVKWLYEGAFTPFRQAFDIGCTCQQAIAKYKLEGNVDTCGKTGEYANGNGGLMRIMPVCLFAYEKEMSGEWTEGQAVSVVEKLTAVTHNHKRACIASGMYYFMVKAVLEGKALRGQLEENGRIDVSQGQSREDGLLGTLQGQSGEDGLVEVSQGRLQGTGLRDVLQMGVDNAMKYYGVDSGNREELSHYNRLFYLDRFANTPENEIKSSGYVVDSIEAAVWCLITTSSLKECLLKAVNLGEDTDSVGAIAGGLAGVYYGYEAIPKEWLDVIVEREWIEGMCDSFF